MLTNRHKLLLEETSWCKKYKKLWLNDGDRYTSFFHRMTNSHRIRNFIDCFRVGGVWVESANEVKGSIANAFKEQLFVPGDWRANIDGLFLD